MFFEDWLATQALDAESRALFAEALVCYRARAYRAALVFCYLAFLRVLAYRLMTGEKPAEIHLRRWSSLQEQLRDDATWDSAVFSAVDQVHPQNIFLLDQEVRDQVRYWRQRRNDAAHSRSNEISAPHVESFFMFVRSNLQKCVVNGGRQGLLERFRRHYDVGVTAPAGDIAPLVASITGSMKAADYGVFFAELFRVIDFFDPTGFTDQLGPQPREIIEEVRAHPDPLLRQALSDQLWGEPEQLVAILRAIPSAVTDLVPNARKARELWRNRLSFDPGISNGWPRNADLRILAALMRNNLIDKDQREEAFHFVVAKLDDGEPRYPYPSDLLSELDELGFFDEVRRIAFGDAGSHDWCINNLDLLFAYLERRELTPEVVRGVLRLLPSINEQNLESSYLIALFFKQYTGKLEELRKISAAEGIDVANLERLVEIPL